MPKIADCGREGGGEGGGGVEDLLSRQAGIPHFSSFIFYLKGLSHEN